MFYDTIGFMITDKCNASCDICCFSCGPLNSNIMDIKTVKNVLEQAAEINRITKIGFCGGEPLLFEELLYESLKASSRCFNRISCNTNGFAFNKIKNTMRIMQNLKKLGLSFLNISTDEFHLKYVDIKNVLNAINIANDVGINTTLRIGVLNNSLHTINEILGNFGYSIFNTHIQIYPFIPLGKANEMRRDEFYVKTPIKQLRCTKDSVLFIMHNGDVFPCCSGNINHNICLGNLEKKSIKELISCARCNKIFKTIYLNGFDNIVDIIRKNELMELNETYINGCELCHKICDDDVIYSKVLKDLCDIK